MRLRQSRTSGHGATLCRTSRSATFCRSRETLFFDGLAPRYTCPSFRRRIGPKVYPRKSKRSLRACLMLVFASFSVSPIRVITLRVQFSASAAQPRLSEKAHPDVNSMAQIIFVAAAQYQLGFRIRDPGQNLFGHVIDPVPTPALQYESERGFKQAEWKGGNEHETQ